MLRKSFQKLKFFQIKRFYKGYNPKVTSKKLRKIGEKLRHPDSKFVMHTSAGFKVRNKKWNFWEDVDIPKRLGKTTREKYLQSLFDEGKIEEAEKIFEEWRKEGDFTNPLLFDTMLRGMLEHGRDEKMKEIFQEMRKERQRPKIETMTDIIKYLLESNKIDEAHEWLIEMKKIKRYKSKDVKRVENLFEKAVQI